MSSIVLTDCSVSFPVYGLSTRSLKKDLLRISTGGQLKSADHKVVTVDALHCLNLTIQHGDRVGLIGHNGAGKSTLLRLISGIYYPTSGQIKIEGSVVALLDIMLGMDMESSGLENITMRGIMYGLSKKDIAAKKNEIIEFTELGDYIEMPIRTYSSGMLLRLAFAIATSIQPEILVLDEVIGAGDAAFLEKAKKRLHNMIHESEIVVLASHDLTILEALCNKILWLDAGHVKQYGDVKEVLAAYKAQV